MNLTVSYLLSHLRQVNNPEAKVDILSVDDNKQYTIEGFTSGECVTSHFRILIKEATK